MKGETVRLNGQLVIHYRGAGKDQRRATVRGRVFDGYAFGVLHHHKKCATNREARDMAIAWCEE